MERVHEDFDPYAELGIDVGASRREIVRAYRRLAHEWHPDVHQHDPAATARFRAITTAYDLLSDNDRRASYDRQHGLHASSQPVATQPAVSPHDARRGLLRGVGPVHVSPFVSRSRVDGHGKSS